MNVYFQNALNYDIIVERLIYDEINRNKLFTGLNGCSNIAMSRFYRLNYFYIDACIRSVTNLPQYGIVFAIRKNHFFQKIKQIIQNEFTHSHATFNITLFNDDLKHSTTQAIIAFLEHKCTLFNPILDATFSYVGSSQFNVKMYFDYNITNKDDASFLISTWIEAMNLTIQSNFNQYFRLSSPMAFRSIEMQL
jgi:hypothetical protein